jgi:hypothetical protein
VNDLPTVRELEFLYSSLTQEERDELLQELLVAVGRGGDIVLAVIETWMLDPAVREFIDGLE